jgi:RNA polymerase sigma-70 factor (ECF subfamily)
MCRIRDGDVAAFEELVEKYWSRTLIYARHLCGDSDRAYDVTQETFSRLWAARESWTPTGSVRVWLLRTARNLVLGDQRKLKIRMRLAFLVEQEYRPVRTPLEETENLELRSAITRAIRKLPERRREAFTLFHVQGLSYREISGIMGVRPQTVMNYVQAGIADLRVLLAQHFPKGIDRGVKAGMGAPASSDGA